MPPKTTCSRHGCSFYTDNDPDLVKQLKRCSCRQVHYCSAACQREDWPNHRDDHKRITSTHRPPDLSNIKTSGVRELQRMLFEISTYDISVGEERSSFLSDIFKQK